MKYTISVQETITSDELVTTTYDLEDKNVDIKKVMKLVKVRVGELKNKIRNNTLAIIHAHDEDELVKCNKHKAKNEAELEFMEKWVAKNIG